jgi:hypothetical protein
MLGVLGEALARSGDTSKGLRMLARSSINLGDSYHDAWCEGRALPLADAVDDLLAYLD